MTLNNFERKARATITKQTKHLQINDLEDTFILGTPTENQLLGLPLDDTRTDAISWFFVPMRHGKGKRKKQNLEQLHERRKQVIRLDKRDIKIMQLVQMTGLSYPTVRHTLDLTEQGGWPAIKPVGQGHTKGGTRLLTPEQEAHIKKTICDKCPEQLKMDFILWRSAAVMQPIKQECSLKLGAHTVGKYLARWGFTHKRLSRRNTNNARKRSRPGSQTLWNIDFFCHEWCSFVGCPQFRGERQLVGHWGHNRRFISS